MSLPRRVPILLIALAMTIAACGDDSSGTTVEATTSSTSTVPATTVPPTTTAATTSSQVTTPELRPESQWAGFLSEGDCFDDVFDGEDFDFSVPPAIVDCGEPHDNEVVALFEAAPADGYPGSEALLAESEERCGPSFESFLGRSIDDTDLLDFLVWPDEVDWEAGVRTVVCAVYGTDRLIGSAASQGLTAPGHFLAALIERDEVFDLALVDGGSGAITLNLTDDDATERLNPPSWSSDGSALVYAAVVDGSSDLYATASDGSGTLSLLALPAELDSPAIKPGDSIDFAFIADIESEELDIYVSLEDSGEPVRLTDNPERDSSPAWSPDGDRLLFRSVRQGNSDIFVMDADGSNVTQLTSDPAFDGDPAWTPDGKVLFISDRTGDFDIWMMEADGSNPVNLTNHPAADEYPTVSHDGAFVVFQSDRHAGTHLWIMRADGTDQSVLSGKGPIGYASFAPETFSNG